MGLGAAPFPPHPGGCEGSRAPGRCLNAPLEAAGQARGLQKEKMHVYVCEPGTNGRTPRYNENKTASDHML